MLHWSEAWRLQLRSFSYGDFSYGSLSYAALRDSFFGASLVRFSLKPPVIDVSGQQYKLSA
jgi:hypothetical protein